MDFGSNKAPIGGTYFRDIYSDVTKKWYKKPWEEFDQLKYVDQKYYCSDYYDCSVNNYGVKCGILLKLVSTLFIKFSFFHQMIALQKL